MHMAQSRVDRFLRRVAMLRVHIAVLIGLCLVHGAATAQAQDTVRC
jgi:hypothetical protein